MSQKNATTVSSQEIYQGAYVVDPAFTKNYGKRFLVFTKGKGVWLWDLVGKKYLDLASGIAVNSFGHGRNDFARIVAKQMATLAHTSNLFTSPSTIEFARRLVGSSPLAKDNPYKLHHPAGYFAGVHLGNSGTEANESALKYARIYASRKPKPNGTKFLAFKNSFHGRTMGALSVSYTAKYRTPSEPLIPGVEFIPFNDLDALTKTLDSSFCAVIVEPIQGEGGLTPMSVDFAQALNTLTRRHEVVLIADEIQSGMGRTGTLFASQALGLEPDIITLAKPLAGGLPASATLVRAHINDLIHAGDHGSTFGGNPVAAALACHIWDHVTKEGFLDKVEALSQQFRSGLEALRVEFSFLGQLRGKGMLLGIEISENGLTNKDLAGLLEVLKKHGVIALRSGSNVLRMAPPLCISQAEVKQAFDKLRAAFREFDKLK